MKTNNNKRIAKNTMMLYFRMLLIMVVSLYTVRVLLSALGQQDYGLYNVIGGIVVMFSFLTHVLSSASQRFFAYDIGRGNYDELSKTYSAILLLYSAVVLFIILLAETVGLWFLHNKMTIPPGRMYAADWVYQLSIMSFCWKVFTSPHQAIIIAHEDMNIYAYVGVLEVLLQLALVFMLLHVSQDRLVVYAVLMFLVVLSVNFIYILFAKIRYKKIHFILVWDKALVKRVVSYSGWTLLGAIASIVRSHGINIVLNVYFTPVVNAARGISHNINSAVSSFSGSFYTAVKPQIVKLYAKGDLEACYKLVFQSTKVSFILLYVLTLPVMTFASEILTLWLKDYPDNTIIFSRLILVVALIGALANPLITFNQATGNIKVFQMIISFIFICNLPFSIFAFEIGAGPVYAYIISIGISICALTARVAILNHQHHFPAFRYVKVVLVPLLFLVLITSSLSFVTYSLFERTVNVLSLLMYIFIQVVSTLLLAFFICLNKNERKFVFLLIKNFKLNM